MFTEAYFPSSYEVVGDWAAKNFDSKVARCALEALGTLPDVVGAAVMTGAAICTLGQIERINETLLMEWEGASECLRALFCAALALNPRADYGNETDDSWSRLFLNKKIDLISNLNGSEKMVSARVAILLALPVQLIVNVIDTVMGVLALTFSLLTLGYWEEANTHAYSRLCVPIELVANVALSLVGLLNPEIYGFSYSCDDSDYE